MRIVAFASQDVCDELASAVASTTWVKRVWNEDAFASAVHVGAAGLVVIDPAGLRADLFERLIWRAYQAPSAVAIYTELTRTTASRIVSAAHRHAVEVILRVERESRESLAARLELAAAGTVTSLLLQHLSEQSGLRVGALPETVVGLFCGAPLPRSVAAMAAAADLPLRSFGRAVTHAGISGPFQLLESARAARYYRDARELALLSSAALSHRRSEVSLRLARDVFKRIGAPPPHDIFGFDGPKFLRLLDAYLLL